MAGRTSVDTPHLNWVDGDPVFDLSPIPAPVTEANPKVAIHANNMYVLFPNDPDGGKLADQYGVIHQVVQPIGVLLALGAAAHALVRFGAVCDINIHRQHAAQLLVKPMCEVFCKVMDVLDAQETSPVQGRERG